MESETWFQEQIDILWKYIKEKSLFVFLLLFLPNRLSNDLNTTDPQKLTDWELILAISNIVDETTEHVFELVREKCDCLLTYDKYVCMSNAEQLLPYEMRQCLRKNLLILQSHLA